MSIDIGGRRYLAWLGTESGYQPLRADLGTLTGYVEISRHRRRDVVQITLGTAYQARDQLRAALADRSLNYATVTEIPFDIELVGSGAMRNMFFGCGALTHAPALDTSNVTTMQGMFQGCSSLAYVPDLDASNVTTMTDMFRGCASLTDGNVRLIGRHPNVNTSRMTLDSGLTREPFYDADGNPI